MRPVISILPLPFCSSTMIVPPVKPTSEPVGKDYLAQSAQFCRADIKLVISEQWRAFLRRGEQEGTLQPVGPDKLAPTLNATEEHQGYDDYQDGSQAGGWIISPTPAMWP